MDEKDASDLHFRMSKKVAQLTKVIYQLNCRGEDSDQQTRLVADRYESEISEIMSDAKEKISSLRDQLTSKKDDEKIQRVILEMTRQHEMEKADAMRIFEKFKEQALQNESAAKLKFDERIVNVTIDLQSCKEDFTKHVKLIKEQQSSCSSAGKNALDELRRLKEKEVDDLVREYNERYKLMLAQQLDEQDKQEKRLNLEWSKKLDDLSKLLNGKTGDLSKFLAEEKSKNKLVEQELATARSEVKSLKDAKEALETDITRFKNLETNLSSSLAAVVRRLEQSEERESSLQKKYLVVEDHAAALEKQAFTDRQTIVAQKEVVSKQTSTISHLDNEVSVLKQQILQWESRYSDESESKTRLGQQSNEIQVRLQKVQEQLKESEGRNASLQLQLTSRAEEIAKLTAQLTAQKKEHDRTLSALISEHERAISACGSSSAAGTADLLAKHSAEIETIRKSLEAERTAAVENLKQKFSSEMEKVKLEHAAVINGEADSKRQLAKDYKAKLDELENELAQLRARLSGDSASSQRGLQEKDRELQQCKLLLEEERVAHATQVTALQVEHDRKLSKLQGELSAVVKSWEERTTASTLEHKQNVLTLEQELKRQLLEQEKTLKTQHEHVIKALTSKHDADLRDALQAKGKDASDRFAAELAALRRELTDLKEQEKATITLELNRKLADVQQMKECEAKTFNDKIKELERALGQLRESAANSQGNLSNQVEKLLEQNEKLLLSHAAEIDRLNKDHSQSLQKTVSCLTNQHVLQVEAVRKELAQAIATHQEMLNKLSADARQAQRDMEENMKSRIASLEKRKDEERERGLLNQRDHLTAELTKMKHSLENEISVFRHANCVLQQESKALQLRINLLEVQVHGTNDQLRSEQQAHSSTTQTMKEERQASENLLMRSQRTWEEHTAQQLNSQAETMQNEVKHLKREHEVEIADLNSKIKQLKKAVGDLEYKYANRESRSEDVERINGLLKEMREKDDALIKAFNDMKYYKLELHNREESYNKVFGRQPSIANPNTAPAADTVGSKPNNPSSAPPKGFEKVQLDSVKRNKSTAK